MSDFKLTHPNFEWEGRQTCAMNTEELLIILGKVSVVVCIIGNQNCPNFDLIKFITIWHYTANCCKIKL